MPSSDSPFRPSSLIRPRVIFGVWAAVWVAAMAHYVLVVSIEGVPVDGMRVAWNGLILGLWALATPGVIVLVQRYPISGRDVLPHALIHLAAAFVVSFLTTTAYFGARAPVEFLLGNAFDALGEFKAVQLQTLFLDLLFYTATAAVVHALDYRRRYQERELRAAQLEGQLAQAQVQALRMQLNPHFLFNTLHAISSLMDDDVHRARRMLVDLSDLLRLSLDSVGQQEVPLDQELAFLDRYLQIERVRFGDRLVVEMDIDDTTLDAFVPNLILQPLVENALKHAVAPFAAPGCITIRARREDEALYLEVQDDGPGLSLNAGDGAPDPNDEHAYRGGLGLRNTRERLQRLYGDAHRIDLQSRAGRGLTVRLTLPFHTAPTFA